MEKKYKQNALYSDKYALYNKDTGELEEFTNGVIIQKIPTNLVTIHSNSYLSFNTEGLKVLQSKGITEIEMGLLMLISGNLSFHYNICMNDEKVPYTPLAISHMIKQKRQSVKRKLNRLVDLNILAYEKIPGNENLGKVYLVNPYLLRRGKEFSDYLTKIFYDFVQTA